jgi:ATP-dependent DNA ligase I
MTGMELGRLVEGVAAVRATTKKTEKTRLLANLLRQAQGRDIELVALYLVGTLPQGRIGIGWRIIEQAGADLPVGDASLSLHQIDQVLDGIASDEGAGSTGRKIQSLRGLFGRADQAERHFLTQLLMGEVRQGALEGLLLDAIAKAANLPQADVRQAFMFSGSIGEVARAALEQGAAGLTRFGLRLLTPVSPMLANTAEDTSEALGRMGEAAFEFKLDGARIQVHRQGDEVRIFTRQLQDVTDRLPEIVEWTRALPIRDILLEGETITLRPDGRPHPFQVTMRRLGRSKNVASVRQELPLSFFFFDCLYHADEGPLIARSYRERTEILVGSIPAPFQIPRIVTHDPEEAQRFLRQALDAGHEGTMAKSLAAPYVAGQRGYHWLKVKAANTLDLVILAAEWGHGRRSGWLSNLHLGARDSESGQFVMLGKTFKGLTDDMLRWQTEKLLSLETVRDSWTVSVRPELVVEIAFNEIQESPRYPGGMALRFARVKRFRPDKSPSESDTFQTVRTLFERQRQ